MANVDKWKAIVEIILMLQPLIEWVIGLIEKLLGGLFKGEAKKEIAITTLSKMVPEMSDPDVKGAVSEAVDLMVNLKNKAGEFEHYNYEPAPVTPSY